MSKRQAEELTEETVCDGAGPERSREAALAAASASVRGLAVQAQHEALQVLQHAAPELDGLLSWGLGTDPTMVRSAPTLLCSRLHISARSN